VEVDGDPVEYDQRGNLSRAGNRQYVYDALNRLAKVTEDGEVVARYRYDAAGAEDPLEYTGRGRRVAKDVSRPVRGQPAGAARFLYAGSFLAEERDGAGALLRQYLYEEEDRPAVLVVHGGSPTPRSFRFLHDAAGSTVGLIDDGGELEETARYGLEGEVKIRARSGLIVEYSRLGNALYFGGLPWDPELGFHSAGGRAFDPRLGRFSSEERPMVVERPLGLNPYIFPGFRPFPGAIAGGGSTLRRREFLAPFGIRVPVDEQGRFEPPPRAAPAAAPPPPQVPAPGPDTGRSRR
jgi:hypothetical protein